MYQCVDGGRGNNQNKEDKFSFALLILILGFCAYWIRIN